MSDDAHRPPKFEWDYEVPQNAFWSNLNYSVGRNFLQCYTSPEISEMTFDENLSVDEKLDYLLRTLDNTLAKKETESAPIPLKDADHTTWRNILLGLSTIEHFAGNLDMEEELTRERYENGPGGSKDTSALQELSVIMEATGRYAGGESMAREVLHWMEWHESLGKESPQAISSACVLATCIWKQKRFEEGQEWLDECSTRVGSMRNGKFAKYREAQRRGVDQTLAALKEWREAHGGP
jgi:hypothetical protein